MEEREYARLCRLANPAKHRRLPPLPKPDRKGRVPATDYTRASIAREIVRRRESIGLSRQELAELAGVHEKMLIRIEQGIQPAAVRAVDKIDAALSRLSATTFDNARST